MSAAANTSVNRMPNKLCLLGSLRWRSGAGYLHVGHLEHPGRAIDIM